MRPRLFSLLALAAFFVADELSVARAADGSAPRRPNVLFLAVDDLRTNLGCYGDTAAITPNIDALAARGLRFTRAYTQQAVCNPSRQSVLTGRRPDTIRVWDLKTHFRQTSPGVVSLPEYFKRHGYHAASFGKIFHGEAPMSDPPSWSEPEQFPFIPKREDYRLEENRTTKGRVAKAAATEFVDAPDDAYPDAKVANAAIAALEKHAARKDAAPLFLAVGLCKPHLPFTAPKRYWDLYADRPLPALTTSATSRPRGAPDLALHDSTELRGYTDIPKDAIAGEDAERLRRGYYAATSFTDALLGKVLSALERSPLARNTVVVLWSDHGFALGEHGLWAKTTNYEFDTRVPLIVAYPGQPHAGKTTAALTELLDLYPTLVDLCGLPQPPGIEGRSLRPWLEDPAQASRAAAFSQFPRPWMYRGEPAHMGYAVRTATHRYVEWRKFRTQEVVARELYAYEGENLLETENLAESPKEAERVRAMAELLPSVGSKAAR